MPKRHHFTRCDNNLICERTDPGFPPEMSVSSSYYMYYLICGHTDPGFPPDMSVSSNSYMYYLICGGTDPGFPPEMSVSSNYYMYYLICVRTDPGFPPEMSVSSNCASSTAGEVVDLAVRMQWFTTMLKPAGKHILKLWKLLRRLIKFLKRFYLVI